MTTSDAWKVSPSGVVSVLASIQTPTVDLIESVVGLSGALNQAVMATTSAAIAQAVGDYFGERGGGGIIEDIVVRIDACTRGAESAVDAYVNGDLEMASQTEREAIATVNPPHLPGVF